MYLKVDRIICLSMRTLNVCVKMKRNKTTPAELVVLMFTHERIKSRNRVQLMIKSAVVLVLND